MNKFSYFCCIAILLLCESSQATIIDTGITTFDSDTGLEWLDLTESDGYSGNEILADAGGFLSAGWSMATSTQVAELFTNAGGTFALGTNIWSFANTSAVELLLSTLGENQPLFDVGGNKLISAGQGWALSGGAFDNPFYSKCLSPISTCTSGLVGSGQIHVGGDVFSGNLKFSGVGAFLYREATSVPEPTTLALLSLGLFGIGFNRRKRLH